MDPAYTDVSAKAGISPSYAHEIVNGGRTPPRSLAIHIFRRTGWRHASIADLSDLELEVFERRDPWTPPAKREAAA